MAKKAETKNTEAETKNTEAVEDRVTILNVGTALIFINGEKLMPDHELEIDAAQLKTSGVEYLFGQGALSVKDNAALTNDVRGRVEARRKKDPTAGKSQKDLEDGGEF